MAAITGMGAILLASGPIACQSYIERIAQAMHAVRSGGDRPFGSRLGAACSGGTLSVQLRQNPVFAPCTMIIARSAVLLGICSTVWARVGGTSDQKAPFEQSTFVCSVKHPVRLSNVAAQWDCCLMRSSMASCPILGRPGLSASPWHLSEGVRHSTQARQAKLHMSLTAKHSMHEQPCTQQACIAGKHRQASDISA